MHIAVVGTGYVGLVTGTCLAETGNTVVCVDIDEAKVQAMQAGQVPIYEPNLETLFHRNIGAGRLSFTTSLREAIDASDIVFLALPTPPDEDGSADLSYVLGVARELGPMMDSYKVIVDKSTVPVGTADKVREAISEGARVDFDVVSNPEFLREGFAVDDFMKPDRIVVGCSSERGLKRVPVGAFRQQDAILMEEVVAGCGPHGWFHRPKAGFVAFGEQGVVPGSRFLPRLDHGGPVVEFDVQKCRLKCVQPGVDADGDVVVLP